MSIIAKIHKTIRIQLTKTEWFMNLQNQDSFIDVFVTFDILLTYQRWMESEHYHQSYYILKCNYIYYIFVSLQSTLLYHIIKYQQESTEKNHIGNDRYNHGCVFVEAISTHRSINTSFFVLCKG